MGTQTKKPTMADVLVWAKRHDILGTEADLREAFEDVLTFVSDAESTAAHAEPHEKYRAIVREENGRCTPYSLGMEIGKAGAELPSPYRPGSPGERSYLAGMERGRTDSAINAKALEMYETARAHDRRYPFWDDLCAAEKWEWRNKAVEALAAEVANGTEG